VNNVEVVEKLYRDFARGDIPNVLGALSPEIEWTEAEGFPYGGTYTGPEAVLQNVFIKLGTEWEGYRADAREFLDAGDRVVALGEYSGVFKATGKSMRVPFAHVMTLKDGKIVKFVQYTDTLKVSEALSSST
jgi:ketosteroid isomerase-like protein